MAGGEDALARELAMPHVLPLLPVRDVVAYGGETLRGEVAARAGRGQRAGGLILTGQLGSVMQESAQAALSYLRARAPGWGVAPDFFDLHDLHLHVPAGAIPKDGPSAGATMA